jgi:hypothetical protein
MDIDEILPNLRGDLFSSQLPALSAGDRGMLDLLTLDRSGRLTILELKADEDLQLPLQALDYWIRVRALNQDRQPFHGGARPLSAFERRGYFAGVEVSRCRPAWSLPPRLCASIPRTSRSGVISPVVEWELIALAEHWRKDLKVVFLKRNIPS